VGGRGETPAQTRGRPCRKCGADQWVKYGGRWRCHPCFLIIRRRSNTKHRRVNPAVTMWREARKRATKAGLPFTITVDDVRAVWPADGRCPVLGVPMVKGTGKQHDGSPTLDRKLGAWGYEKGNIAVMCLRANRAKSDLTAAELEQIAAWMRGQGLG
jgi:hypothetical protein